MAASSPAASSPAERYAAARRRGQHPRTSEFAAAYPFPLDDFQVRACRALEDGEGVLVAAPTGAGKTVVGEFGVHLALANGEKCFYTTPIKALSNQKYHDFVAEHGADQVGLLTGDNAINGDASIVVMTTEVLRNMLYAGSPALRGLGYVVMDEVHYLSDRFRGAVWEEVIIHLPAAVRLVSLSATVSNTEEFADWLVTVRGHTRVIVDEERPVPLWQHMMVGRRLYDLFSEEVESGDVAVNPQLERAARQDRPVLDRGRPGDGRRGRQGRQGGHGRQGRYGRDERGGRPRPRYQPPSRVAVLERLDADGLLPAITFIFSRAGCDAAVQQCLQRGLRLTTDAERDQIRGHVAERTRDFGESDLAALGYWEWLAGLERGVAAHHAGMLPAFKEIVEELFVRGLVKAVFATETLALGINMPARSVVLERLSKWNGETHVDLTPGEYTQLTGRAGRRGIDIEGHAIVLWRPEIDPAWVAGLASTRTYPLRSSFRPSYNMAVNLVGSVGREHARTLLESSFAQFQADRSVVGLGRQITKNLHALEGYQEAMTCHLGDFSEYAGMRDRLRDREAQLSRESSALRRAAAVESLERLRPGDVVRVPAGKRSGLAVVLDAGTAVPGEPRPLVVTEDRWAGRLSLHDFPREVEPLGRVKVPRHVNHRSPQARRDLASTLRAADLADDGDGRGGRRRRDRSAAVDDPLIADLRLALRRHPCHGCDAREDHARWAERFHRLRRDTDKLERRVETKTNTIARTFDRVCALLEERGYLDGDEVTPAGRQLARVYSEADLLVAECLRAGVWDGLGPAELAACLSALVYEPRRPHEAPPRVPPPVTEPLAEMVSLWADLDRAESEHRLDFLGEPDAGFAWASWRWARGDSLASVLAEAGLGEDEMPAGDFVRWMKQLLDLVSQLIVVAEPGTPLHRSATEAAAAMRRGVVSYSSVA